MPPLWWRYCFACLSIVVKWRISALFFIFVIKPGWTTLINLILSRIDADFFFLCSLRFFCYLKLVVAGFPIGEWLIPFPLIFPSSYWARLASISGVLTTLDCKPFTYRCRSRKRFRRSYHPPSWVCSAASEVVFPIEWVAISSFIKRLSSKREVP